MRSRAALLLGTNYHYPVWTRLMEITGIAAYVGYGSLLAGETMRGYEHILASSLAAGIATGVAFIVVGLVAMMTADFVSGVVHCAADNFGHEKTPIFGVAFIRPFRDHHRDPKDITRHDFIETNGNSCLVNLTVLVPTYYLAVGSTHGIFPLLASVFVLMFTVMIVLTNQVHKWSHQDAPPRLIVRLQKAGVILSPENHQVHHTPPFDRNYCITTGWMNSLTERTRFFAWMVRTVKGSGSQAKSGRRG